MISLADFSLERRTAFVGHVADLVKRSGMLRHESRWPLAVVVLRGPGERSYATSRADFAHWCRANDLQSAARECKSRVVPRGCILLFVDVETETIASTGFHVLPLAAEVRAVLAAHSRPDRA